MKDFLETDRIQLRFIEPEDESFLYELNSDPEVMTWLTDGRPNTREEIAESMVRIEESRKYYKDRYGGFIAIEKDSGLPFAWFCLRPCHSDRDNFDLIEIGWRLKRSHWKRGLATEGGKALIKKALDDYKVPVVFAKTMAGNLDSIGVMKRLGMSYIKDYTETHFPGENKQGVWYEISRSQVGE